MNDQSNQMNLNSPRPRHFLRPHRSFISPSGQRAWTVFQPASWPILRFPLDGQSAGLASVAIRSMKTRQPSFRAKSQNTETKDEMSSRLEYPLIKAPSTASESIKMIKSVLINLLAKVSRARIGANISMGTICVFLVSQVSETLLGTTSLNCTGAPNLRSNMTAPTRSGERSLNLGSGVNPSVKMTTSLLFRDLPSIGLGGPSLTSFLQWHKALIRGSSTTNSLLEGKRRYCLSEITLRKARPTFPQPWTSEKL